MLAAVAPVALPLFAPILEVLLFLARSKASVARGLALRCLPLFLVVLRRRGFSLRFLACGFRREYPSMSFRYFIGSAVPTRIELLLRRILSARACPLRLRGLLCLFLPPCRFGVFSFLRRRLHSTPLCPLFLYALALRGEVLLYLFRGEPPAQLPLFIERLRGLRPKPQLYKKRREHPPVLPLESPFISILQLLGPPIGLVLPGGLSLLLRGHPLFPRRVYFFIRAGF